jgi:hypothetical protein
MLLVISLDLGPQGMVPYTLYVSGSGSPLKANSDQRHNYRFLENDGIFKTKLEIG